MKAISIRQPWAWLIVHGYKDVENRTRRTSIRGPVLIHASQTPDPLLNDILEVMAGFGVTDPDLQYGGIVGRATIVDCVTESDSEWFEGPVGYVLDDPQPLPFWPCPGQLGFFEVPAP